MTEPDTIDTFRKLIELAKEHKILSFEVQGYKAQFSPQAFTQKAAPVQYTPGMTPPPMSGVPDPFSDESFGSRP